MEYLRGRVVSLPTLTKLHAEKGSGYSLFHGPCSGGGGGGGGGGKVLSFQSINCWLSKVNEGYHYP